MGYFGTIFKQKSFELIESITDYSFKEPSILNDISTNLETPLHSNLVSAGKEVLEMMLKQFDLLQYDKLQIEAVIVKAIGAYRFDLIFDFIDVSTRLKKLDFWYALMGSIALDSNWNNEVLAKSFGLLFNINFMLRDDFEYISKFSTYCHHYFAKITNIKFITITEKICRLQLVLVNSFGDNCRDLTTNGEGRTALEARNNACFVACKRFKEIGILEYMLNDIP